MIAATTLSPRAPLPSAPAGTPLSAALRGLQRAGTQAAEAAERIAGAGAAASPTPGAVFEALREAPDAGRAAVDLLVARRAYAANAAVLRSAAATGAELVRRGA